MFSTGCSLSGRSGRWSGRGSDLAVNPEKWVFLRLDDRQYCFKFPCLLIVKLNEMGKFTLLFAAAIFILGDQQPTVNSIYEANGKPALLKGPKNTTYKIDFWTDPSAGAEPEAKVTRNCSDNHFGGVLRKAAKTSTISASAYQSFATIKDVFSGFQLPSDQAMKSQVNENSPRIAIEKKGVKLGNAYLYAFTRESDNDYHLIIGDAPTLGAATLMNMEISGLPSPDNTALDKVRSNFVSALKLNDQTCLSGYVVFTDKPIPVHIEGPVFYDIDHQPGTIGPVKGSVSLRPKTSWEVHPVTAFALR